MEKSTLQQNLLKRFLTYVSFDTMSDPHITHKRPTTEGQMELLRFLFDELQQMGISDCHLDEKGYLIARIPSTIIDREVPVIGFMAHVDVADDVMGNSVSPRVIESYDGKDVQLNETYTLLAQENPELARYIGQTIVVTDGNTLLGGDDKAGVAILLCVAQRLMENPSVPHGAVEFIFTSDEETGFGMDGFDVSHVNSRCCYTIDGGELGEIEAECFNAATVKVTFTGIPYHLGAARGKMVNSVSMAVSFIASLPRNESPEATDGRYGYYCAEEIHGTSLKTQVAIYVRDFEIETLQKRIETIQHMAKTTEMLFPGGKAEVHVTYSYYNMGEAIKKDPLIMEAIWEAGKESTIALHEKIIRGGTDGARLAQMGIPAPNIFTGSHNLHSRFEWLGLPAMEQSALLVEHIIAYWGRQHM